MTTAAPIKTVDNPKAAAALRKRIEVTYMALLNSDSPYGALSWFARQCKGDNGQSLQNKAARRWIYGERNPSPEHIQELERWEGMVGSSELNRAVRRWKRYWDTQRGGARAYGARA